MKVFYRFSLATVIIGATCAASAQSLSQLQDEWRAINAMQPPKRFEQLIPKLLAFRAKAGGKSWQLNYMLGSSYCRIPGQEKNGKIALFRVLASYGLPDTARTAAEDVISNCGGQSETVQEPSVTVVAVSGQTGAVVHGKGGFEVRPDSESATSKLQASPVSVDELKKRVFARDNPAQAEKSALALEKQARGGGPLAHGAVTDTFVVTSVELPAKMTGECLARYRRLLESQFKMQTPAALITVYTVPKPELVPQYAARLHGVHLPLGTIAYSVFEDLSIVGIAAANVCGSLAHELVHLSMHQSFGDSPAWLEEGLASEVAVATPRETDFRFNKSWRDQSLREHWKLRPSVSQLLSKTWAEYATEDMSQVRRVAALHAMAASFIRYLDARHVLVPVYLKMRDSLSSEKPQSDEDILKTQLGMNVEQIDADFTQWFGFSPPN